MSPLRHARMFASLLVLTGCGYTWKAPEPTQAELDRGLIVLYPGVYNTTDELWAFYVALRSSGVERAIEIRQWGPQDNPLLNIASIDANQKWAVEEAARIKSYLDTYPNRPVELIGFSGGAAIAIWTAEALPVQSPVDRVILISAGVSPEYDLRPMLDRTRRGAVHYYSPLDGEAILAALFIGLMDQTRAAPAGSVGFTLKRDDLIQVGYNAEMEIYGNSGNHADILQSPLWFSVYMIPYVLDFS